MVVRGREYENINNLRKKYKYKKNSYMNIFLYPFELFFLYTKISEVKKNMEDEKFL
jgi:hypothetical protein